MALTSPIISNQFAITQSNSPSSTWNVTDATDYTDYGLVPSEVVGNLKLTAPSGVIHNNTSFASPDIDVDVSTTYAQSMPLQTGGLPLEGAYAYQYVFRVTKAIVGVTAGASGSFVVSGNRLEDILSAGTFVVTGSTGNDATYTVASATYNSGTDETTIVVTGTVASAVADGDLYYDLTQAEVEFDFYFCEPDIELEFDLECNISTLQSTDTTNYTITSTTGGYSSLAPTSVTRIHKLRAPAGITPAVPDVVGSTATIIATPIYTKTWTAILTPTVTYDLPSGVQVVYTITATDEIKVSCDTNLCSISSCLFNIYQNYLNALSDNYALAEKYREYLIQVNGAYIMYSIGVRCGNEDMTNEAMADIRALANATGCDCCGDNNSDLPTQIIPLGGSGSGTTTIVATSGNGITIALSTVGTSVTYTLGLNYTTIAGNLAADNSETLAGVLTSKFVTPAGLKNFIENLGLGNNVTVETNGSGLLIGATKNTAYNKDFGIDPLDVPEIGSTLVGSRQVLTDANGKLITGTASQSYEILYSEVGDVPNAAATTETTLYTYTLPGGTLDADNNFIQIEAEFTVAPPGPSNPIYARLYFGGTNVFAGGLSIGYDQIKLVIRVYRTGATAQLFIGESFYRNLGTAADIFRSNYSNPGETLANPIVIKATGQATLVATGGLVVAKNMLVTLHRQ